MEQKPPLPSTWYDIIRHNVVRVGIDSAGSKIGDAVDSVGEYENKPGHKQAMNSFLSKLSFRASLECMIGRDSREEEKHRHLPNVHEHEPCEGEVGEHISAPSEALDIVACTGGISNSSVKEKDSPGEGDSDYVDSRQAWRRSNRFNSFARCLTIFHLP